MAASFQQGLEDAGAFADEVLDQAQVDEEQRLLQGAPPPHTTINPPLPPEPHSPVPAAGRSPTSPHAHAGPPLLRCIGGACPGDEQPRAVGELGGC